MKKKRLFVILLSTIILMSLICILPFPTKLDLQLQGAVFKSDGTYVKDAAITISGYKLDFLISDDKMQPSIDISTAQEAFTSTGWSTIQRVPSHSLHITQFHYYSERQNTLHECTLSYNNDFTHFRIATDLYIYIGSTDNTDPTQIFNEFAQFHK